MCLSGPWLVLRMFPESPSHVCELSTERNENDAWEKQSACSGMFCFFSFFFLIREETGTDVTGSQTGCCDYNTMKMPDCVMDTERPKSRALACAMECGCESAPARRCECGDGGKRYQAGSGNRWPQRERPLTGWFITVIARMFFPSMCGSSPFQTLFFFSFFLMNTH